MYTRLCNQQNAINMNLVSVTVLAIGNPKLYQKNMPQLAEINLMLHM